MNVRHIRAIGTSDGMYAAVEFEFDNIDKAQEFLDGMYREKYNLPWLRKDFMGGSVSDILHTTDPRRLSEYVDAAELAYFNALEQIAKQHIRSHP